MRLTFEWELPDLEVDSPLKAELLESARREIAIRLFAEGRVSSGYAADLLQMPRDGFIQLLRERRIPLFSYKHGEFETELTDITELRGSNSALK